MVVRVLHLVGSRRSKFYYDLSVLYGKACDGCVDLDRERFEFHIAVVHLDGSWSFPSSLDEADGSDGALPPRRWSFPSAVRRLAELDLDVSLVDLLDIPLLGNHDHTIWLATDKAITKQILHANGIQVPQGELLQKFHCEWPTMKVPVVVKPCNEDLKFAIDHAFSFDSRVVVEEYIAGREVRAGVIEEDGGLTVLPKVEYFLKDIRTAAHKLQTDSSGNLLNKAIVAAKQDGDRQCPADLSDVLHQRIDAMVTKAHHVLKCRHYSLYDIRIDENEQPFILEAAFFCSFAPLSTITFMADHSGRDDLKHPELFHSFLERAAQDKKRQIDYLRSRNASEQVPYVIQEVLQDPEHGCYAIFNKGKLTGFEIFDSVASCLVYSPSQKHDEQVMELVAGLGKAMNLTGQLALDLMHTSTGQLVPIECNPRSHSAICTLEGHQNLSAIFTDPDFDPDLDPIVTSRAHVFRYWIMDQIFLMLGFWEPKNCFKLSFRQVLRGGDAILCGDDPMPFLAMYLLQITSLLLLELFEGTPWLKIDFCIGKIVKEGGD